MAPDEADDRRRQDARFVHVLFLTELRFVLGSTGVNIRSHTLRGDFPQTLIFHTATRVTRTRLNRSCRPNSFDA